MNEVFAIPSLPKGRYRHYKGNEYNVLGVGCHTESYEYYVVYSPIENTEGIPEIWIRPYDMFVEYVKVNETMRPRFEKI